MCNTLTSIAIIHSSKSRAKLILFVFWFWFIRHQLDTGTVSLPNQKDKHNQFDTLENHRNNSTEEKYGRRSKKPREREGEFRYFPGICIRSQGGGTERNATSSVFVNKIHECSPQNQRSISPRLFYWYKNIVFHPESCLRMRTHAPFLSISISTAFV